MMALENILKKVAKHALKLAFIPGIYLLTGIDQTPKTVETTLDPTLHAAFYSKNPNATTAEVRNALIYAQYKDEAQKALRTYHVMTKRIARNGGRYIV